MHTLMNAHPPPDMDGYKTPVLLSRQMNRDEKKTKSGKIHLRPQEKASSNRDKCNQGVLSHVFHPSCDSAETTTTQLSVEECACYGNGVGLPHGLLHQQLHVAVHYLQIPPAGN